MRFALGSAKRLMRCSMGPVARLLLRPTGGGKSLCYQFPAAALEGTTIVISPLIALMEDQVHGLTARGISATYLASNLDAAEKRTRENGLKEGRYRLVYVAPERLAMPGMIEQLAKLSPPLVAIDEAHCISQWGHDFRPDYLRLGEALKKMAPPRILACTATATPTVRDEILEKLGLPDTTKLVLRGFARPNLHLAAEEVDTAKDRARVTIATIREALGSPTKPQGGAIVYAATRKNTEALAGLIAKEGWKTAMYHAGLPAEQRANVSHDFAAGSLTVVVATNAFGMGIDRPDIRVVVHANAPGSIEAYYQEVGRAGRDGKEAHGLLLSASSDLGLRRRLLEHGSSGSDAAGGAARVQQQWKLFLDLMRYVDAGSCRHDFILRYFGDEQETLGGCGHCDVCERLGETDADGKETAVTEADATLVRKALAGVARMKGRAGLHAVADMLCGVDSEKSRKLGLLELSTFGVMKELPRVWVMALLKRMIVAGLVDITATEYPVPLLTKVGGETMMGTRAVRMLLPDPDAGVKKKRKREPRGSSSTASSVVANPPGFDASLFDRLREVRLQIAKDLGMPAYVVAHDRTLREIAAQKPTSKTALAQVYGMGPARIDSYGDQLIRAVQDR
jgi:ATP-dependent DNA helicase RecQ